jgi:hypothetical protein
MFGEAAASCRNNWLQGKNYEESNCLLLLHAGSGIIGKIHLAIEHFLEGIGMKSSQKSR